MNRAHLSAISLVAANVVPIFGVLFGGWELYTVFLLYWAETAVIGFYNLLKLAKVKTHDAPKAFLVFFFIIHFGIFMVVHLMFTTELFAPVGSIPGGRIALVAGAFRDVALAVVGLVASHGISFFQNFIGKKEYERTTADSVMVAPYGRVVILHVTIIFGGVVVTALNAPVIALIFLIILKTVMDLIIHVKRHAKLA